MKNLRNTGLLFLTWVITLLCFGLWAGIATIYYEGNSFDKGMSSCFIFLLISIPFSSPAFIFFFITGLLVLKKDHLSMRRKKGYLLLLNYTDIIGTAVAMLVIFSPGEFTRKDVLFLYPIGVLMVASTLSILLLPFKNNPSTPAI